MVRIDTTPQDIQNSPDFKRLKKIKEKKLKRQSLQDLEDKEKRWKRSRLSTSCFIYLVITVVLVVFILAIIAKTGIIEIPIISSYFYQKPQPTRVVIIDEADSLESILRQNISAISQGKEMVFEITEGQLTALLNEPLATDDDLNIDQLQAVITPQNVEIFGHLISPVDAYLVLDVIPRVNDGRLDFDVADISLGSMPLPASLANFIIDKVLMSQIQDYNEDLKDFGTLSDIELSEGKLKINAQLK